ncbi:nuclear transport factor 2 family protein [Actinomadura sediminis]|uniref:Nuclear transport factor 2 family protein n=1 Tax=Actinomadura sediminis TaxID=1038904 RepID=A0ABW3EL54_9ACTN
MSDTSTMEKIARRYVVRSQIEQFYAEQMALLDEGDAGSWVNTFVDDGVFVPPGGAPEVKGRSALLAGTEATVARLAEAGTVRRHVLTNLNLVALVEGGAQVTAYVLIVDSAAGESRITTSTVMRDQLVSDGRRWYVARRAVSRDDLDASSPSEAE